MVSEEKQWSELNEVGTQIKPNESDICDCQELSDSKGAHDRLPCYQTAEAERSWYAFFMWFHTT